ncbi:hypothetical protein MAQA_06583 [Listeria aquatica FSL S10-1188]|uniref:Uncharacterized protein n=1 Tax=Listeria aquatica FSL S10-1188 TaxID=1265818 RepID=W7B1R0_9LIST|nr:hypothetical protein MAQA_06583 [Listeria aquatica FSL S10-1188]
MDEKLDQLEKEVGKKESDKIKDTDEINLDDEKKREGEEPEQEQNKKIRNKKTEWETLCFFVKIIRAVIELIFHV